MPYNSNTLFQKMPDKVSFFYAQISKKWLELSLKKFSSYIFKNNGESETVLYLTNGRKRRKFNATILFPIDSNPLKSASVISLFLSAPILYEEAETHNHISQSIGALLKHQLLSRGSFVTLLI